MTNIAVTTNALSREEYTAPRIDLMPLCAAFYSHVHNLEKTLFAFTDTTVSLSCFALTITKASGLGWWNN